MRANSFIPRPAFRVAALIIALSGFWGSVSAARAADQLYFSAVDNIANVLVQKINAETVRIDVSMWLLTERTITAALANRFKAGVQVRLIGDRGSIFEIDQYTRREFYWLASQGVPIRLRSNPTWYPEIAHWKASIFAGQNIVMFGSANYTPFELAPSTPTNYKDEVVLLSDDPALVNGFRTKFDRMWNDTTPEPESIAGSPPYLKNWDVACAAESVCGDYTTQYPVRVPMIIDTRRLEPDYPIPADVVWGQGASLNNRLIQAINAETSRVDFVAFRITVANVANALLQKHQSGVPVRVIMEPQEYQNRKWPEFWLTRANIDKLWAAGVPVKQRVHAGLTHMKVLITSQTAMIGSSNFAAAWQRDHNYFLPAATKPVAHQAMRNRIQAMWNDPAAFGDFVPIAPDAPALSTPAHTEPAVSATPTLTWERAPFAVSFDVYLGTSAAAMSRVANVPALLVNDPPATYSWTPGSALQSGTTYFWKVVSRTNATAVNPSISASSPTRSFTTAGTTAPPPPAPGVQPLPSPWQNRDVGSVGQSGSASSATGTFTVNGAGANIWGNSDGFHFAYQSISGDAEIVARVETIQAASSYAKAGVMVRETLSAGSPHVILNFSPGGNIEFMTRSADGGSTAYLGGATQSLPAWLKLSRRASTVTAYISANGTSWTAMGSTTLSIGAGAHMGLVVSSHDTSRLSTSTFTNVAVTSGAAAPPPAPVPPPPAPVPPPPAPVPAPAASDVVIYAKDIPTTALRGAWSRQSDSTSPGGIKLVTSNDGFANTNSPLVSPTHFFDVTFNAVAGATYRIWLRLRALNNDKYNDAVWVQFSNAVANGAPAYPIGSPSGLLVNLATDATASSLDRWGWQNGAYWLSQGTALSFATTGTQTLRIQVREDGVQLDQIVLSPITYLASAPGAVSNDQTIVPK